MNQISQTKYSSIEQMTGQLLKGRPVKQSNQQDTKVSFQKILESQYVEQNAGLKFSKHANERLQSRNIDLSEEQLEKLTAGTKKAQEKGISESLVVVDNIAFIVNVKNSTVITALDEGEDKIFTNIDGAVIM
ncbi:MULTISPECIES: TIGR02530 family flagellar biosynthesis protein [Clostridia]|jgi:flagellar operon protein|uniref:TIGR02530 family flagellar biosynthesis protein n=1 Tax=Clostridia TaxID=186801 RepID=UPI00051C36A2|nr:MULTISPECIES: TIGR02530 family flagellar biosynthesis protein [Clostridia]WOO36534.1 TIGR02530 family flagellar biosynthesis protein [Anaerocolumna sp. AGMB13020]